MLLGAEVVIPKLPPVYGMSSMANKVGTINAISEDGERALVLCYWWDLKDLKFTKENIDGVETKIISDCLSAFGSLSNALRFAASKAKK